MRRVIKRSSSTEPGNDDGNPELVEFPDPKSADAESSASKPSEPKPSKAKPTKLPLWDFLEADERDTDGTTTVLYRLEPVINRKHGEHFISKKNGKLTREAILEEFGSGVYHLFVKDVNNKLLYKEQAPFHHHAFPPRMDPAEVVAGDPRNEVYFRTWGKKATDGDKSDKGPSASSDMNTVLNTVLDKTGSFDPKLADLWEKTARERDDLSKLLAQKNAPPDFVAQAKAFKELFPQAFQPAVVTAPAPQSDKSEALAIIAAMKGMQPDQMAMLAQAKQLFVPAQPAIDGLSQFREIFGFALDLVDARGGGGGGGRRSGWDVGVDILKEGGQHVLQPALAFIQNMMLLSKNQGVGATPPIPSPTPTTTPSAFDPYQNPQATRAYANTLNSQQSQQQPPAGQSPSAQPSFGQPASPPPPSPAPPPPSPHQTPATSAPAGMQQGASAPPPQSPASPNEMLLPLLQNYGGLIQNALNGGVPGYDFADNVASLFGNATHAMIANHGEQVLAENMLAIPELAMFGEFRLRRFAHEFVNYEEFLDQEEGVEDDDHGSTETNTRVSGRQ